MLDILCDPGTEGKFYISPKATRFRKSGFCHIQKIIFPKRFHVVPFQYYLHMDGRGSYEFKEITPDTVEFGS